MDHIVYLDAAARELERLLDGSKTMVIRGAAGRKLPYGRVHTGDTLYFVKNDGDGRVLARGKVCSVYNSDPLSAEESARLVRANQARLQLTPPQYQRWSVKRYLVLIKVCDVRPIPPITVDRSRFGSMDDWLPVGSIAGAQAGSTTT